jgi:CBS domain-containing protein
MQTKEILRIKGNALYTVAPGAPLGHAISTMVEQDIGSLVVMDRGHLLGMLSFREVLKAIDEGGEDAKKGPVSAFMVKDPLSVGPDMEMDDLRRRMLDTHTRYVPVMEEATLVGVLSFHDVAKAVLEEQSFENRMLKGYIKNWPDE